MIYSPLRYPGGKRRIADMIKTYIPSNIKIFIEPFCGGASVALEMLISETVDQIILNDKDKGIYCLWQGIFQNKDKFIQKIKDIPLTVEEYNKQKQTHKELLIKPDLTVQEEFNLGFATFYLNRTNRSGVITGGIAGGKAQTGKYKLDARFNKTSLIKRIEFLAKYKDKITVYNMDVIDLLHTCDLQNTFIYFDPPYYNKGSSVYSTYYKKEDHKIFKENLEQLQSVTWLMTYDNAPEIAELYADYQIIPFKIGYSITKPTEAKELLILSHNLKQKG